MSGPLQGLHLASFGKQSLFAAVSDATKLYQHNAGQATFYELVMVCPENPDLQEAN